MILVKKNELFLLEEITKRNFASKYKDSVLGIFWSVLKPLLIMAIFTIIFSTIFKGKIDNFPVYFLSAKCIYDFFTAGVGLSMYALIGNKSILKRTAAPKHIFILGSITSEFLNFIISLILLFIIMIITKSHFYFSVMPLAIIPIISLCIMITGISFMIAIMCVYYTDIQHLWGVFSLLLMYSSALFYPIDIIPEPFYSIMILNPFYWIVDQFRSLIYQGIIPETSYMLNSLLLSTIFLVLGLIIYIKYEKRVTMKF